MFGKCLGTYSNFLSESKVGWLCPSTESISVCAFFILEGFCNKANSLHLYHHRCGMTEFICAKIDWQTLICLALKLEMNIHTCARKKIAQVRTAAVVSCPAISIVIKSSLSCQNTLAIERPPYRTYFSSQNPVKIEVSQVFTWRSSTSDPRISTKKRNRLASCKLYMILTLQRRS